MPRRHGSVVLQLLAVILLIVPAGSAQHLYLGNNAVPGGFRQYDLPLSASSAPNFSIPIDGVISIDVDGSGNVVVGDLGGNISFFPAPLSAATTRSAFFPAGGGIGAYQFAFTPAGDLFVACSDRVQKFNHPFSNFSTPVQTISPLPFQVIGVALDTAQNLYVALGNSPNSNLLVFAPPYTGIPVTTQPQPGFYRKLAASATQLFVAVAGPGTGRVDVYNLPVTNASTPAFAITSGLNLPETLSFDSIGNLYVGNLSDATVAMFRPPFSSSSAPAVTAKAAGIAIFGLTVEKTGLGVLPGVVSSAGAGGSFFRTGLQINNPNASPIKGRIVFHPAGTSGIETDPTMPYSLNPGETQSIADLLPPLGLSGIGSGDVIPGTGGVFPTVAARVFNDAGSKGTTGFTEDLIKQESALGTGDQFALLVPADLTHFRYNIGVRALSAGASVTVSHRSSTGALLQTISKTYPPNYFEQVDVTTFLGGAVPSANDSIAVKVNAGNLFVYGAATDNTTQDPSVQMGRK